MAQALASEVLLATCLGVLAGGCTPALTHLAIVGASGYSDAGSALTPRTVPAIGILTTLRSLSIYSFESIQPSQVRELALLCECC